MKLIVLVRHAKAEEPRQGRPDHERSLAPKGREDAQTLGKSLTSLGFEPEIALVSDAARTAETWELVSRGWDVPTVVQSRELYTTTVGELVDSLRDLPPGVERVIVVGHNPTMTSAAAYLAGETSDDDALSSVSTGLRTGTAALLEHDGDWGTLGRGSARLRAVVGRDS